MPTTAPPHPAPPASPTFVPTAGASAPLRRPARAPRSPSEPTSRILRPGRLAVVRLLAQAACADTLVFFERLLAGVGILDAVGPDASVLRPMLVAGGLSAPSAVFTSVLTHRLLHQCDDPCLFGGGQPRQSEGGRPHGTFVEVGLVAEAERRVPRLELLRILKKADHLAVLGVGRHPVPEPRREGRRSGLDDTVEPLGRDPVPASRRSCRARRFPRPPWRRGRGARPPSALGRAPSSRRVPR